MEGVQRNEDGEEGRARIFGLWNQVLAHNHGWVKNQWWLAGYFSFANMTQIFRIVAVYMPNNPLLRRNSFAELTLFLNAQEIPTLIYGDFNAMRNCLNKTGKPPNAQAYSDFNRFVLSSNLNELCDNQSNYTWSNRRQGKDRIFCKLDWGFTNSAWERQTNVVCALFTAPRATSDHKVIMVKMDNPIWQNRNTRRFRVLKPWMLTRDGRQVISEAWGAVVQGCPMLRVLQKLEVVKHNLIYWNKNSFGRIEDNIKSLQSRLSQAQAYSEAGDGWATREEESIKKKLEKALHLEEIMWKEKSRVKWLSDGDKNTRFFQTIANNRSRRNRIAELEVAGQTFSSINNVLEAASSHFESFFNETSANGRACLITHNLSSMGNFWMQAFSLPNEVLKKLEQCMARFLWVDTEVNRHIHQIAWHTLCKPKAEGGIGLRLLEEVNVSLLASRLCSSFNNNSLFAQWIRVTYLKSNSLWTVRKPWRGSWAWKSLGKGWNKVANWVRWKIGDGNSVFFWSDWWHDEILVKSISGEEYGVIVDQLKLSVAEVRSLGEARLTLPSKALTAIMSIQLANETDKLVTRASWTTYIASHMRLTTQDRLQRHGVHLANRCHLCKRDEENNVHVMFKCSVVQNVWRKATASFGRNRLPWQSIDKELQNWSRVSFKVKWIRKCWMLFFPIALWKLWWFRNKVAHERLTTVMSEHIFTVVWRSAKEAFQRLQLKEDERKAMSTWLQTGILCEGRLSSLSMDTNVLQIVTYKKGITTMVMGMWRLRDMESIETIFTEVHSREDEAELQLLNGWLQSMARVNGSLGIISNNEGWKRRLRAMLEGRRPINQKWHHMRAANQRLRVLSHLPTLEAGEQMCLYGERDGRDDGG
ncbi:putative ribonuclease H protein [Nymphaea thermarum]|nr:putative ribonuclease H protein [Nymphaea thermarum]